jgi:cell shape-determining protein MreC
MKYDKYLNENNNVLSRFEALEGQGRDPKMAVYRGRSLIIISSKADGLLEKISQIFKDVIFCILKLVGILNTDIKEIEKITDQCDQYLSEQDLLAEIQEVKQLVKKKKEAKQEENLLKEEKNCILKEAPIKKDPARHYQREITNLVDKIYRLQDKFDELEKEINEKISDLGLS